MGMKQKKKNQNGWLKKTEIFKTANSKFFRENFMNWFLGWLIDAKGIDVAQLKLVS